MKFTKTAVAVAIAGIAAAPMIASAETTLSGTIQVKVQDDNAEDAAGEQVTDVNFAAGDVRVGINTSHQLNSGLTGYGNVQFNLDDLTGQGGLNQEIDGLQVVDTDGSVNDRDPINLSSGATVASDNVYVGVKGGFGDIRWGEIPSAAEYGQLGNDIFDCCSTTVDGLSYTGSFGPVSLGLNYSPAANSDVIGVGAKFNFAGVTIGLGAEDANDSMTTVFGASYGIGGFSIGGNVSMLEAGEGLDDTQNTNLKLGYGAGNLSLGLTIASQTVDLGETDATTNVTRVDVGYDLGGGMDISTRINNEAPEEGDDVLYYRVMLTKAF